MALVRTSSEMHDIRGRLGGVYFSRDRSGLHTRRMPRSIYRRSSAQLKQRGAFSKARAASKVNRTVSYLIYLALNNMPFPYDVIVTGYAEPDCRGRYVIAGTYFGTVYYTNVNLPWDLWYIKPLDWWVISHQCDELDYPFWLKQNGIEGPYWAAPYTYGVPVANLEICPAPPGYDSTK